MNFDDLFVYSMGVVILAIIVRHYQEPVKHRLKTLHKARPVTLDDL